MITKLSHELQVHFPGSLLLGQGFPPSLSKVKGLVRTQVKIAGGEKRHIPVDHLLCKAKRLRLRHIQGVMVHPVLKAKGLIGHLREFPQMPEGPGPEHLIEMPEAGKAGNKVNVILPAIPVQLQDIFRRQRGVVTPHLAKAGKQKAVFNIDLQLVDLVVRQLFHQLL